MGITAGLAESNGSLPPGLFMTHVSCKLTAKNRDQLRNPTLGYRVWASFYLPPSKRVVKHLVVPGMRFLPLFSRVNRRLPQTETLQSVYASPTAT